SNAILREYTWGLNRGGGIGGLLDLRQGGQHYSYLYDGKGNVDGLIDDAEVMVAGYVYSPFGRLPVLVSSLDQAFRFSTKAFDEQTGLAYYGYRFYAPGVGRWINRDPIGEAGGINLYGFVGNGPVNWVDPNGFTTLTGTLTGAELGSFAGPFGAAVGAVVGTVAMYFGGKWILDHLAKENSEDTESNEAGKCEGNDPLDDYPADPDDWDPPDGWEETNAGEKTGGKHRQWRGPNGELRRWDKKGREGGKERGPHWHDPRYPGRHIPPTR
ncbi:MAG: RHS repeat-associated core domain-containing protein, partial [Candidatus Electrothrix sp. AX2]|nr:RHS repeat-associated core domain-containing protein [Candidatus Electrothrix gigas]